MNFEDRLGSSYSNNPKTRQSSSNLHANRNANFSPQTTGVRAASNQNVITPASIRAAMPPVRDIEYENLKRFQSELFRVMMRAKDQGLYQAEFQVHSIELDNYTLDVIFEKMIAVLRNENFFVTFKPDSLRVFIVSWDPILTQSSVTQKELQDPNSNASIRIRRFNYLKKKNEQRRFDEREAARQYEIYQKNITTLDHSPEISTQMYNATQRTDYRPFDQFERSLQSENLLNIDRETEARSRVLGNLFEMNRESQQQSFFDGEPLEMTAVDAETLKMMRQADQVAGAETSQLVTDQEKKQEQKQNEEEKSEESDNVAEENETDSESQK